MAAAPTTPFIPGLATPASARPADPGVPATVVNVWPISSFNTYGHQFTNVSNSSGNGMIAVLALGSNTQNVLPRFWVADDAHNFWQYMGTSSTMLAGASRRVDVWAVANAKSASIVSVAESWFTSGVCGFIMEVQGLAFPLQVDFINTTGGNGSSAAVSGTATGSDICVAALLTSPKVTSPPPAITAPGFTNFGAASTQAGAIDMTSLAVNVGLGVFGVGSVSASYSWSLVANYQAIVIGFKNNPTPISQPNPNWPTFQIQAAFGFQPANLTGTMPTWTDITTRAIDEQGHTILQCKRGRDFELTQPEAGSLDITLDNSDGAFNPASVPTANVAWNGNGSNTNPQLEQKGSGGKFVVIPNQTYSAGMYLWSSAAWASGMKFGVNWYDGSNTLISTVSSVNVNSTTPQLTVIQSIISPSNAAKADFVVTANGTPPAGTSFFAAATGLNVASPSFPSALALTPPQAASWVTIGSAGTVISQQNGWIPSADFYPYVLPEVPVRVLATWQNQTYPIAFAYANKWPQSYPDPQLGVTPFEGSDTLGIASNIKLPSALGGEYLIDNPYVYLPLGEFFSVAGGQQFANLSRTNLKPGFGVDNNSRSGGLALSTGLNMNIAGDQATGVGATGYPANGSTFIGGPGVFYQDSNLPPMGTANGITIEFWAAITSANIANQSDPFVVDILRLVGQPSNYPALPGGFPFILHSTNAGDGTRLLVAISNQTGQGIQAWITDYSAATAPFTLAYSNALLDTGIHHYVLSLNFTGPGWGIDIYKDGVSVASGGSGTGPPSGIKAGVLAIGPLTMGSGYREATNFTVGQVALYPFQLDPARITAHFTAGSTAQSGEGTRQRYAKLMAYGGVQIPFAATASSQSPLIGNADQIQGQAIADAAYAMTVDEGGMFYCSADGTLWYASRTSFYNAAPRWIFGDNPANGETPYLTTTGFDFSDTFLYNIVSSVRTVATSQQTFLGADGQVSTAQFNSYGADAVAEDVASEAEYFPRGPLQLDIETTSDQDAYDRVNWSLLKYRQPQLRANQVFIDPASNPAAWPTVLGIEQGDIVRVIRRQLNAPVITLNCVVQQVEHEIGPSAWGVTVTLAPYFPENSVIELDNPGFNTLSTGVVLPW